MEMGWISWKWGRSHGNGVDPMEMGWTPWKWGRSHGNGGDPDPGSVPQPGSSSGDPGTAAPSWWSREWASSGRRCRQVRGGGDTGGGPHWRFPDPGDPPGCPLRGSVGDTGGVCPLTPQKGRVLPATIPSSLRPPQFPIFWFKIHFSPGKRSPVSPRVGVAGWGGVTQDRHRVAVPTPRR